MIWVILSLMKFSIGLFSITERTGEIKLGLKAYLFAISGSTFSIFISSSKIKFELREFSCSIYSIFSSFEEEELNRSSSLLSLIFSN